MIPESAASLIMSDVVDEYRTVLIADESIDSLDSALKLGVRIASGEDGRGWHNLLKKRPPRIRRSVAEGATKRSKDVAWMLSEIPLRLAGLVERVPDDQYSLLMDTLLLVVHQAYFALLPELGAERGALLRAFKEFSASLPRRQDRFHVLGMVEIEQNDLEAAVESFRTALASTHSDEHDFITRVQMVWTLLMERGCYPEAFECLMDVYPRTARADLTEISALLRETFLQQRASKTSASRARKRA